VTALPFTGEKRINRELKMQEVAKNRIRLKTGDKKAGRYREKTRIEKIETLRHLPESVRVEKSEVSVVVPLDRKMFFRKKKNGALNPNYFK
jgi:hypothetical protein